jgi:7,8-dihydropterin-6-yl-methyl-4-(beta-D-ribofuranosyl)aminobenzene 5'-phosphate synthase
LGTAAYAAFPGFGIGCSPGGVDQEKVSALMQGIRQAAVDAIRLSVVYDNVPYRKDVRTDWGFACLVEGLDKNILFDSGRYDDRLMANLSQLQIAPRQMGKP